ncbi:cytochrome P450 [Echria macrotheca]|uniref:Cytochrome P450 n=1 Tax=Echria macrotheca TaxID=438768 RepID=A0AAJ0B1S3_9PEZI|nr:cytochrome P450 [Echria macrotheca]
MLNITFSGLVGAISLVSLTYFLQKLARVRQSYKGLPGPPHSFLWGHLKVFGEVMGLFPPDTYLHYFYTEMARRYDLPDVWYLDLWPVGPPQMIITSPEASAVICSKPAFPIHGLVDKYLGVMLGPNVIAAVNGQIWKDLHHMIGPSLTPMAVKSQASTIVEHVMIFHDKLRQRAEGGEPFEMADLAARVIFDVTSAVVLGFPLDAQNYGTPLLEDIQTLFALTRLYLETWNPVLKLKWWWKIRSAGKRTDAYLHQELQARYKVFRGQDAIPTRKTARSVLDRMVVQRIEGMGDKLASELDADFLRLVTANLKGLIAGGAGTTSDTISHIYMLLSQHPDVMTRLRDEHDRIFPHDLEGTVSTILATPSKTNELEYTTAVIKESLRMFPIGFASRAAPPGRTHLTDKGVAYPIQGQMIIPNQHALHYDPRQFPDPDRFLPDRFLESYEPKAHRFAWRPFERGIRACMGQDMAMDEMRIVLLLTVRWFDFETMIGKTAKTPRVTFSALDTKIGDLAFQTGGLGATPRDGMPMKVRWRDGA